MILFLRAFQGRKSKAGYPDSFIQNFFLVQTITLSFSGAIKQKIYKVITGYNNMEIVKNAVKVGNSAGVLLPKEWLGTRVKVILEPLEIDKEIIEILRQEEVLKDVLGVYITGSYARREQTIESDVDILVITDKISKRIKRGKYEILCIAKKEVEKQIKKNILPILPMLKEAIPVINKALIRQYASSKLTLENLRYHIETTKSAMKVVEKDLELSGEIKEKASDASAYSLILRLRTLYIIDCLKRDKLWSKKEFLRLIIKISGSDTAYKRYENAKNKNTQENKLGIEEAEKLLDYISKKNKEVEEWLAEKRD